MGEDVVHFQSNAKAIGGNTARRAINILLELDPLYHCPTRAERKALLVGYAMCGKVLYGAAFDIIRLAHPIDLSSPEAIAAEILGITVCEIKSTNRLVLKQDLKGYFFNITAAELLTAQSVGERYRFLFVNTLNGEHQEMGLSEVLGRARGMYPAWHIRF